MKKYKEEDIRKVMSHPCFEDHNYSYGTFGEFFRDCLIKLLKEGRNYSGKLPIEYPDNENEFLTARGEHSKWEDVAGEALSILEPKIGEYAYKVTEYNRSNNFFIIKDRKLYLDTFNCLMDHIFYKMEVG